MLKTGPVKMSTIARERTARADCLDWQPTEEQEQISVIEWRDLMVNRFPELRLLIHVPNGGWRSKSEAVRLQRMGVKPGVSDLFLPVARGGYHGIWIEAWLDDMNAEGYLALRADGAEQACDQLFKYLTVGGTNKND